MNRSYLEPGERGFTLTELLVVVAIMGLVAVISISAFAPASRATNILAGGHAVVDALDLARQAATTQNRYAEVRFYNLPGTGGSGASFSAFQIYLYDDTFTIATPFSKLTHLPTGIVMVSDATYSPILSDSLNPSPGTQNLPGAPETPYNSVQFHPNGSTSLNTADQWFITVKAAIDASVSGLPARDFFTIQVNPVTGRVLFYQP